MKKWNFPLTGKCFLLLFSFAFVFASNMQSQTFNKNLDNNKDWVLESTPPQSLNATPDIFKNVKDTGDVMNSIPTQSSYWQGMTWDGQSLWCSEILLGKIHQVDPAFGTVIKTFDAPGTMVEGLAWDGTYLWAMENGNGPTQPSALYKLDPEDGSVIESFDNPFGVWLHGITFDGEYLWMVDFSENLIYRVNPNTGDVVHTISTPGDGSVGLTWDGNHLWTDDIETGKLYCLSPTDGAVLYEVTSPHPNPRDLAWDGNYLWVMASQSQLIYQVDVGMNTSTHELNQSNDDQYSFSVYPNPVANNTKVCYELNQKENIKVQIFSASGNLISTIVNSKQTQGEYSFSIHGNELLPGVYFCVLNNGKTNFVKKMVKY